jgi:hypothetical protein
VGASLIFSNVRRKSAEIRDQPFLTSGQAESCTIQTQSGPRGVTTPGSVALDKGSSPLPISRTKNCYVMGSSIIPSNTETMAAGNVLLGGVIGLGVDAATGAMNKYPDLVTVAMTPDPTCGASVAPQRRERAS